MKITPHVYVALIKTFFNTRFRLAGFTRKSKTFERFVSNKMFDGDDMVVLPKDNVVRKTVDVGISIPDPGDSTVLPSDVVKTLIGRADDIFIMNFCICRTSNKCKDFPADHGCMFLGKGVHRIPPEFGRMVTAEEAVAYIDECTDLGMVHIIGRNKLDSIWLGVGDKHDLMTVCNCCPCCCLWNMARTISDDIGEVFKRMDGVDISLDSGKCIGCGSCKDICFTKAVSIADGKAVINQKYCRGCGRCVEECPTDAITITFDESKVNEVIDRIGSVVDLS